MREYKPRPTGIVRVDPYTSFPFVHNQFTDRQSQSGTLGIFIQFLKTLEYLFALILRDPAARIRNGETDLLLALIHGKREIDLSLRGEFSGIRQQVSQQLL